MIFFDPDRLVDVVVPVYKGYAETRRCLESVLSSPVTANFELIVIDDASPDAELSGFLETLVAHGQITLLRNPANLGFVGTVNRGMSLHPERDVVLLNSDTEVANDWLDRLRMCAYSDSDIGTVTPFTNNGTICSYPYERWPGGMPGVLGLRLLDQVFAHTNARLRLGLPTAVGFCMYIRRDCLQAVGLFDAERFGRGYGEENDFCRRAVARGWRNVLAADVFVYHEGSVSFSEERHGLQERAMRALLEAHPDYLEHVQDFIARDPAAPLRAAIDRARGWHGPAECEALKSERELRFGPARATRSARLHLGHSWGGGTERWMSDFRKGDGEHRNLLLRSRSERNYAGWRLELLDLDHTDIPVMAWNLASPITSTAIEHAEYSRILAGIVEIFGVQAVFVSSLVGHSLDALTVELPTIVVLHDLFPFCPAMFGYFEQPCSDCGEPRMAACFQENELNAFWHNTSIADWLALRAAYVQRLGNKHVSLVAPTSDIHTRLAKLLPAMSDMPCVVIPHGLDLASLRPDAKPSHFMAEGDKLRIVIPGRLNPHKGLRLLGAIMTELLEHADILLLGCGEFGQSFTEMAGITIVPEYSLNDLHDHIQRWQPDIALLLSVLPESFSYTLSEMWALGVPVAATRLGAFAERIEHGVNGWLLEPSPEGVLVGVKNLAANRGSLVPVRAHLATRVIPGLLDMVSSYQALMPQVESRSISVADEGLMASVLRQGELERQVDWFRREYHQLSSRVERLSQDEVEHSVQIEQLRVELGLARETSKAMLNSTSWKLTAPVRAMKRALVKSFKGTPRKALDSSFQRRWESSVVSNRDSRLRWNDGIFDVPKDLPIFESALPEADAAKVAPNRAGIEPLKVPVITDTGRIRVALRQEVRHALGLPDAVHLVVVDGVVSEVEVLDQFESLARICLARRNDVCFVLLDKWGRDRLELRLLRSSRRLFFADQNVGRKDMIVAGDVLISMGDESESRGYAASLALPVLFLGPRSKRRDAALGIDISNLTLEASVREIFRCVDA